MRRLHLFLSVGLLLCASAKVIAHENRLAAASQELIAAAKEVDELLTSIPEPTRTGWKRYLRWESWGPAITRGGDVDREALENITSQFYGVYDGLERPALVRMRKAIAAYLDGDAGPTGNATLPSVVVRVKRDLLAAELSKLTATRTELKDTGNWIAGAWVTGKAHCKLNVMAKLAPYRDQAAVELLVTGTIETPQTTAHKGKFAIHGSAVSQVRGTAHLYLENDQIRVSEPQFTAKTDSQISSVDGPKPLRVIAKNQAGKKQEQGEAESSDLIASQAAREFKQQVEAEVAKSTTSTASWDLYQKLLTRSALAPTRISTHLSEEAINVGILFPGSGAKGGPSATPMTEGAVAEFSIHESVMSAITANFVRGSWWQDEDFTRLQKELTGSNSNELLIGATPERWSVRWDWKKPVDERITSEFLEYRLRFSSAKIDGREIATPFSVIARYHPAATRWGLEFKRVGEVALRAEGDLSPEDESVLTRKFGGFFTEFVYLDGISPPAGGGWDGIACFATSGVRLEDEWFRVDIRLEEKKPKKLAAK